VSTSVPGSTSARLTASAAIGRPRDAFSRWFRGHDQGVFVGLVVWTLLSAFCIFEYRNWVTTSLFMVALLLTDILLPPRRIPAFVSFLILVVLLESVAQMNRDGSLPNTRYVNIVVVLLMAGIVLAVAWRRARLGVAGLTGDAMLVDLKERISRQGLIPALPLDWHLESASRSAGFTSFAGDFLVAHRSEDQSTLSLVLVDVSGKGVDAGTRSLLLSGALGGLIGSVPPEEFLPSANEFLLRQGWEEGFATAVHLSLDLVSGDYEIRSAGHPPAIGFLAGSGKWRLHDEAEGPVLGLVPRAVFPRMQGRLRQRDTLLLYTDGLVERSGRDISLGIDRLIGEGERLVRQGFVGSAQGLVDKLGASNDDCAVVVLERH
jgi:hypothetical protein